ncbi:hypothetical protein GGR50DRAFT_691785 [Xylaria sp. CBS 124048]|nr:hypothetical protein GGR50DRAFT_691785 [Xylaria sp. CBS 124048]
MEQNRFPRRSASHGALRSSASSQCVGRSPLRPFHKPLRSVNENSILLHSPGALESMLKTTTETGDIGIFTIKPVPPSPMRGNRPGIGHPHPRSHRSVDNLYRQNLAIRSTSRRDTATEAVSVHGSDSLESGTSNLSPNSSDDPERRSYSMTTCGSQYLSHYRSTNTLQSQASLGSHLQRPRSPFPYPTRLKRPGVRPASPAVTENGRIDYSRMVEIDRVSYRTVHGQFKHGYSPRGRRPYPLSLRADVNLSTPSLVPPGPPPAFHGPCPPSSVGTHSPASMTSWNPPFRDRFDSTSMRTSSLTSVTNIHHRMLATQRFDQSCVVEEPPPRYYDYTEDFENKSPWLSPSTQPFAPPLLRTDRYDKSMMLRDDDSQLSQSHLAAVFGEDDSAFNCENQDVDEQDVPPGSAAAPDQSESHTETSSRLTPSCRPSSARSHDSAMELEVFDNANKITRSSDIDLLPSQIARDSIDAFNPTLDFELRDITPTYNYAKSHANTTSNIKTKSPERHVQVLGGQTPAIRSEQGVILRDDTRYQATGRESPESHHSHVVENEPSSPNSLGGANEERHEDCSVLVRDETQHDTLPSGRIEGLVALAVIDSPKSAELERLNTAETETSAVIVEERTGQGLQNDLDANPQQQFRRHRRNHAVLRISTTNLPRDDNEGHPHIPPTRSTAPLVSPKPISPARQLKVKNSIPRLMKALPPLPGVPGYDVPPSTSDVPEEDEFSEILVPFGLSGLGDRLQLDQSQHNNSPSMASSCVSPKIERDGPKFKLKIKPSGHSEISGSKAHRREWPADENIGRLERLPGIASRDEFNEKHVRSRNYNRLKVRSSRRSTLNSSNCSTVRHNPGAEKSGIVTSLMQDPPQDLFNVSPESEVMSRQHRRPLPKLVYSQATVTSITPDSTPSEERVVSASYKVPSTISTSNTMPSIDRDTLMSSIPPRGLLKRLSNLRVLLTASTTSGCRARGTDSLRIHNASSNALPSVDFNPMKSNDSLTTESTQRRLGQRIRTRLFRWIRGAKTGMRNRANKKHSRHRQGE